MRRIGLSPVSLLVVLAMGCAATSQPAAGGTPESREAEPVPAAGSEPTRMAPLTKREAALARDLRRDVTYLATEIGERSHQELWNQASTTDYLVSRFEAAGHRVERQGYSVEGDETAQNLQVQIDGGARGYEIVVVGAHYDSAVGSPGANDNASGVAALLALARSLGKAEPSRAIRLVAFANQEEPYTGTPTMGSRVYAKRVAAAGDRIAGVIAIESIGYFTDESDTQQRPGALQLRFPDTGDFVAVVGNQGSTALADTVLASFERHASLPVEGGGFPDAVADLGGADPSSFWLSRIPAVLITDTGALRYPHHHAKTDTPDQLDFERMARVVAALEQAVLDLASPPQPDTKR